MKKIFEFFLKNTDSGNEIEYSKAKLLLILGLSNIILMSILILASLFGGGGSSSENVVVVLIYLILIVLIYYGYHKFAGNFFVTIVMLNASASAILNYNDHAIFYYFMNEYYLFLFAIVFAAMFASRVMFVITSVVMFFSAIVAYSITKAEFPELIVASANNGIVTYLFVMVMTFILTYFFTKFINTAIKNISDKTAKIEAQNLKMKDVAEKVKQSAYNLSNASVQLTGISQQISQSTNEQVATTTEISSAMEQILATVRENAANAEITEDISTNSAKMIEQNKESLIKTLEAVSEISRKITVIAEIASKTDILSINAAIEAARAGDSGKGFSVVAGEIRKLADKTSLASSEIGNLSKVNIDISEATSNQLENVIPEIQRSSDLVKGIVLASREQQAGIEMITTAILQLTEITNANSISSEEMSVSAEELSSQADALNEVVSSFS